MPCATVHLLVAEAAWTAWRSGTGAPFPLNDHTYEAFLHGALGPDLGFIPGADRFVSELAHYHRPAALTRALLEGASSEREVAFAWGWASHVVGDVRLHPLVGRAVGERLYGDRERRIDASEDPATHVSIEVGVDMALLEEAQRLPAPPRTAFFDTRSIQVLTRALEGVHTVPFPAGPLLRDHRLAVVRTARWPFILRTLNRGAPGWARGLGPTRWLATPAVSVLYATTRSGSAARGLSRPLRPSSWLIQAFREGIEQVVDELVEWSRTGLDAFPDANLESGELQPAAGDPHPAAVAVRARLDGRRDTATRTESAGT